MQQQENNEVELDYGEADSSIFAPSISVHKTINGKPYYIRRFFKGGKDFEKTMRRLAVKQAYKDMR